MRLSFILTKWREQQRLTVQQAAAQIGISRKEFVALEAGHLPSGSALAQILRWLMTEMP